MKINKFVTVSLLLLLLAGESSVAYSVRGLPRLITEQTNENSLQTPPVPSPDPRGKELKTSPTDGDKSTNDKPVTDDKETKAITTGGDKSTNDNPIPNDKEPKASTTDDDKSTNDDGDKSTNDKPIPNDKEPKASTTKGDKSTNDVGDKSTNDNPIPNDKEPKASTTDGDKSTNDDGDKSTNDKPIPNDKEPKASTTEGDKSTNDDGDMSTNDNPIPNDKEPKASTTDGDKSTNDDGDKSTNDKPVSNEKEATASLPDGDKSKEDKPKDVLVSNDPGKSNPKSSQENDNKPSVAGSPTNLPAGSDKNIVKKEKSDGNADTKSGGNESCEELTKPCRLQKDLTVCLQSLESGSKGLGLLIINEGESTLKVNITLPTSRNDVDEHVIPGKQSEKISISPAVGKSSKILLRAGDEECTLSIGTVTITTQQNFINQLPSYYKQITPIYIAYFICLVALIIGGTCACCQLKKRKHQDGGVPYQELEMGISESVSATNVETTDGWDDGWDDDWDEDKAVKSPGPRAVGISANGLTARTSKQDGWGKEWDD